LDLTSAKGTGDTRTEKEDDKEKLHQLSVEHEHLKRRLIESEAEMERLREVVNRLLDKKKGDDKVEVVASESDKEAPRRYWLQEEHDRFLAALQQHGPKAMKAISDHVATRTPVQVRTHAQKYFQRLHRVSDSSNPKRQRLSGCGSSADTTDDYAVRGEQGGEGSSDISSPRGD